MYIEENLKNTELGKKSYKINIFIYFNSVFYLFKLPCFKVQSWSFSITIFKIIVFYLMCYVA